MRTITFELYYLNHGFWVEFEITTTSLSKADALRSWLLSLPNVRNVRMR